MDGYEIRRAREPLERHRIVAESRQEQASRAPMGQAEWRRLKEAAREWAQLNTFEGRIEKLEALCKRTPGAWPNRSADERPDQCTRAWYAEEILFAINAARHHIGAGQSSYAASEALSIGALAAEADARIGWREVRTWLEKVDSENKEQWLKGEVIRTVALSGQISESYSDKHYGLDMEIEFKDDRGKPTGKKLYLQLKSGDSHLRTRKRDGAQIHRIRHKDHADYWMGLDHPVFLVIGDSRGRIGWMEIRDYLKREAEDRDAPVRQIVFSGDRFTVESIQRWRDQLLG